jgi:serine/threonine-protein kinase HipA
VTNVELDMWLGESLVAQTVSRDRGRKVRIIYEEAVAARYDAETPLLSCSLPTPGPSEPAKARAFLEGLLPEGRALETAAAQVRGARLVSGATETPIDAVALLAEYGRECAGAVVVMPSGDGMPTGGRYEPLDDHALSVIVRDLPQHPVGSDLDRDIRMSLAGAQPKFLLARIGGRWCEPLDGAPSTHIIKPTTSWKNSAENEALVMNLGRACGLTDREAWSEQMGDSSVFVAERYDRRIDGETIVRLHQEDMCQALGMRPTEKYLIGRPSERMARLLREFTDSPGEQALRLFRQIAFRSVVGDEDGHGKNYSLLLDGGQVRLAPLYDSLCTLIYPELSGHMGTQIGAQRDLAKVDRAALLDEARAMRLTESEATEALDSLAESIRAGIEGLNDGLTTGWNCEQVIGIALARTQRLEAGLPLGGASAKKGRSTRSLDEATAQRQSTAAQRP